MVYRFLRAIENRFIIFVIVVCLKLAREILLDKICSSALSLYPRCAFCFCFFLFVY